MTEQKNQIAISACLLGQQVRYDGQAKKQAQIVDFFLTKYSAQVEVIPFCPEVAIGLGVPRPKIQLMKKKDEPMRVLGVENHTIDVTKALQSYAKEFLLRYPKVQYLIVKSRSPSCGYQSTPFFVRYDQVEQAGLTSGMFVQTIQNLKPDLPVIDEIQLMTEQDCLKLLEKIQL